jgi:hypothetical protein
MRQGHLPLKAYCARLSVAFGVFYSKISQLGPEVAAAAGAGQQAAQHRQQSVRLTRRQRRRKARK